MKERRGRKRTGKRAKKSVRPGAQRASKAATESFLTFEPKKQAAPTGKKRRFAAQNARASECGRSRRRAGRRRSRERSGFCVMDAVLGLTGVAVLLLAVAAAGVYSGVREVNRQAAAMAELGKKMESIGVAGEGVFTAVADARAAALEAARLEEAQPKETKEYEEKELVRDVKTALRLSSIQKDLKIKFVNQDSGKLIGNQPFEVRIEGPETRTERDGDEDGIISIGDIAPGEYTVTILSPDEVEGSAAAGVSGTVTVKDEIVYEKVDIEDEVKKESEINAAKEDTEIQNQVESVLTDTVEWVESTKTPLDGGGWEEVPREEIPAPDGLAALTAAAPAPFSAGAWFAKEETVSTEEGAPEGESAEGESAEEETGEEGGGEEPAQKVSEIRISESLSLVEGVETALSAQVSPEDASNRDVEWKVVEGDAVFVDQDGTVKAEKAGTAKIQAFAADGSGVSSNVCAVTVSGNGSGGEESGETEESEKSEESEESEDNEGNGEEGGAPLKDGDGNALYYKEDGEYKAATAADYEKYEVFYREKPGGGYRYTGWQTLDGKRYYFDRNGEPVTGEQVILGMKYVFLDDGSLQVNGVMGIDVSRHNGSIDWNAVKNSGVEFVIIRCGYRGSSTGVLVEDELFRENIRGASAAGLKVGVYVFSQAVNEAEAVEEASMAVSAVRGYSLSYPIFIDVEGANGRADGLSVAERTAIIRSFCQTVINSGYTPGIYSNRTWLAEKIDTGALGNYKIWMAQYAAAPTYGGRYEMWQYSSQGNIPGISGDVDLNISYLAY